MKVQIKNFQSAADVELEIKGFTALVGKSNIGKSAVIRAIQGALTNREGDDFVTTGEKNTEVTLDCPALSLVWRKGGGYNDYEINGEKLENVGRGAPPQIAEAGFGELEVGRDSINVQIADQFHPLFLLNDTGSLVAEAISDVGRLKDVQAALRNSDKDRRSVRSTKKVRKEDLDETREELNRYENYDEDMDQVKEVRSYYKDITALDSEIETLDRIERKRGSTEELLQRYDGVLEVEVPAIEFGALLQEIDTLDRFSGRLVRNAKAIKAYRGVEDLEVPVWDGDSLVSEINTLEGLATKAIRIQDALRKYKGLDDVETPEVASFEESVSEYDMLSAMATKLKSLVSQIPVLKNEIQDHDEDLDQLKEELHEVLHEAGSCPTCEREV